jgi:inorganic pyrophosphatase
MPKSSQRLVPVIVETARGARSKLEWDAGLGMLRLTKVLPAGFTFPLNFGSIPGTRADDGDPLDIMLFMSDSVPAGTLVAARPIGVLEAEQIEKGKAERNDRLFGVAAEATEHRAVRSMKGIEARQRRELERFFQAYNSEAGREFRPLGWFGPKRAWALIEAARRRHRPEKARPPRTYSGYAEALSGD